MMRLTNRIVPMLLAAAALGVATAGCGTGTAQPTQDESPAEMLSAVDGTASADDFQQMLDCLTATGAPGTETEEAVGDTMVASWDASSKQDTLYDFSAALASVYGC
jgi:hypothetical protein